MSGHTPVAKAIDCLFRDDRWLVFTRFLDDGHVRPSNNAAERSLPWSRFWREVMALRPLRARLRQSGLHAHADCHGEDE